MKVMGVGSSEPTRGPTKKKKQPLTIAKKQSFKNPADSAFNKLLNESIRKLDENVK